MALGYVMWVWMDGWMPPKERLFDVFCFIKNLKV